MSNLLSLPIELIDQVFMILDYESLLRMRKVSKFTKELAEATILNRTDSPSIDCLKLVKVAEDEIAIKFFFDNIDSTDRLESKSCLISAFNLLHIHKFMYCDEKKISIVSTPMNTRELFHRLTPLIPNAKCEALQFYPTTLELFSLTSSFFDGKIVNEIIGALADSKEDRDFISMLVAKLQSSAIRLNLSSSIFKFDDFLVKIAGMVDGIEISAPNLDYESSAEPFLQMRQLAFNVLNSRCFHFDVSDGFIQMPFEESFDLAEVLSEIRGKRMYFSAPTNGNVFQPPIHAFGIPISIVPDLYDPHRNMVQIGRLDRFFTNWLKQ